MELCEEYRRIENQLTEYWPLEQRLQFLVGKASKSKLLAVAMRLGPSAKTVADLQNSKVQGSTHVSWIYEFGKACDAVAEKSQAMSEEIQECILKQAEILRMVDDANLSTREKLYVELHYYRGLAVKELERKENMRLSKATLCRIRLAVLEKINKSFGK